jgi:hypothetical protein
MSTPPPTEQNYTSATKVLKRNAIFTAGPASYLDQIQKLFLPHSIARNVAEDEFLCYHFSFLTHEQYVMGKFREGAALYAKYLRLTVTFETAREAWREPTYEVALTARQGKVTWELFAGEERET